MDATLYIQPYIDHTVSIQFQNLHFAQYPFNNQNTLRNSKFWKQPYLHMCAFYASQHCFWQRSVTKEIWGSPFLGMSASSCLVEARQLHQTFTFHSIDLWTTWKSWNVSNITKNPKKGSSTATRASQSCHECLFVNFEHQMNNVFMLMQEASTPVPNGPTGRVFGRLARVMLLCKCAGKAAA